MPIREMPKFKSEPEKMLEIPQPGIGGLNLNDLEYEQNINQSPYMLNMMYRNGAFAKRYGQDLSATYPSVIFSLAYYDGEIFAHAGDKIYKGTQQSVVATGLPTSKGIFIIFAQKLYYLITSGFYEYDGTSFNSIDAYVPDFIINAKPDGSTGGDVIDDLNILGNKFKIIYNGEAGVTEYSVGPYDGEDGIIDWDVRPKILVDDVETNDFTVDTANKKITFTTAPGEGSLNVSMEFTLKSGTFDTERSQILNCKFYETFGGANNSRLFVAGGGQSKYFWTQAYDISYFPENNYATLGNTEEDITGFGRQYNVLIVFKPREVYSIYSYTETSATTVVEENIGLESFRSQLVNARIGCDAPYSIQLINNLLTWFNTNEGVCTLVSTNIQDERNVRIISRNIEHTNRFSVKGVLDYSEDPDTIQSADFENKYFLVFPESGMCFVWDYEISPYRYSANGETNPRDLSWFLFDKFHVKQFLKVEKNMFYATSTDGPYINVTQLAGNGNFADTSVWQTDSSATLTVENNVATLTDGVMYQTVGVEQGKSYYVTLEYRNTDANVRNLHVWLTTASPRMLILKTDGTWVRSTFVETINTTSKNFQIGVRSGQSIQLRNVMIIEVPNGFTKLDMDLTVGNYLPYNQVSNLNTRRNEKSVIHMNDSFRDFNFDIYGNTNPIHSYYMTPFLQFNAVEYLKNVTNIYIQCRGDTNTKLNVMYYSNDDVQGETEPDPIVVYANPPIWNLSWQNFTWFMNTWGTAFRRKCNIKKVQMFSSYFENNDLDRDMSITHIGMQYKIVKNIR